MSWSSFGPLSLWTSHSVRIFYQLVRVRKGRGDTSWTIGPGVNRSRSHRPDNLVQIFIGNWKRVRHSNRTDLFRHSSGMSTHVEIFHFQQWRNGSGEVRSPLGPTKVRHVLGKLPTKRLTVPSDTLVEKTLTKPLFFNFIWEIFPKKGKKERKGF